MPDMTIDKSVNNDLIVKDSHKSNLKVYIIGGALSIVGLLGGFGLLFKEGVSYFSLFMIIVGFFSTYGVKCTFKVRRSYKFHNDENKLTVDVKGTKNDSTEEYDYYHVDIAQRSNAHGLPYYTLYIFLGEPGKVIPIDNFESNKQPKMIKEYCVDVLKRTTNYEEPKESLEETTKGKGDITGILAETARGILRALR